MTSRMPLIPGEDEDNAFSLLFSLSVWPPSSAVSLYVCVCLSLSLFQPPHALLRKQSQAQHHTFKLLLNRPNKGLSLGSSFDFLGGIVIRLCQRVYD